MNEIMAYLAEEQALHTDFHPGSGPIEVYPCMVFETCINDLESFKRGNRGLYVHRLEVVTNIDSPGNDFGSMPLSLKNGEITLNPIEGGTTRRRNIVQTVGELPPDLLAHAYLRGLGPAVRAETLPDGTKKYSFEKALVIFNRPNPARKVIQ